MPSPDTLEILTHRNASGTKFTRVPMHPRQCKIVVVEVFPLRPNRGAFVSEKKGFCRLVYNLFSRNREMRQRLLMATLIAFALSGAISSIGYFGIQLPTAVLITPRWIAIGIFSGYALYRRSLTTWILVAMVAGAALGHDWPQVAVNLRVLSQIFLRLIKAIIAPLLFATLVSGIASHADLKKVGRMGVKALVFFEVVTTLALVIGLAAINLSRAGGGATLPSPGNEPLQVQKLGVR